MSTPPSPAWKMIYLARRNPALSFEAFPQAWREHAALGRACRHVQEKIVGVTQCVRLDPAPARASTAFDGLNLLRLRDRAVADDIWNDPETLRTMRPDEPRVFDRYVRESSLVAREDVLADGPMGDWLLAGCLRAATPATAERLPALLRQACGEGVLPAGLRVVLNQVEPQRPAGYDFDLVLELWAHTPAQLQSLCAADENAGLSRLGLRLAPVVDHSASVWLATRVSHRRPA